MKKLLLSNSDFSFSNSKFNQYLALLLILTGVLFSGKLIAQSCTHTLYMTDTYGDGWNGNYASVSVNGVTVISNVTLGSGFGPASVSFSASSGQTIRVWRSITGSWSSECQISVTNNVGTTVIPLQTLLTGSPTSSGSTGTAICASMNPAAPTAVTSSVPAICTPGSSATLTAQGAVGTVYWYTGGCGSTFIGTGNPFVVTPGATTTYYARNYNAGLFSTTCASYTVTVSGSPAAPTTSNVSVACGATATLTASGGGGTLYSWYTNSNATGQVGAGNPFVTPANNATTTYYVTSSTTASSSQTFSYTGSMQTWTVPAGVTSVTFTADGAAGAGSSAGYGNGGLGGRVQGTLNVTPGQVLNIYVGGAGSGATGGYNGGGSGPTSYPTWGGGGGGATDIRIGGTALADRVLVAAGGGGAGYNCGGSTNHGGGGGGTTGITGWQCNSQTSYVGVGATQASGGANLGGLGTAGSLGQGGNGYYIYGGGGGGGYYGGGGGSYGGGGGGSSWVNTGNVPAPTYTSAVVSGNGSLSLSWTGIGCESATAAAVVTVSALAAPTASNLTVGCGTTASLTATGGGGNSYAWYTNANGTGQVGQGSPYTTPALTANTTYYVASATIASGTQTFNYTGGSQTWTVPAGVTSVTFTANGASGASGTSGYGNGGLGGRLQGTLAVTPGQVLNVYVGGSGTGSTGGYNGGGTGPVTYPQYGGGGGGATDIRIGGTALANRVLVAAGGGGGGSNCFSALQNNGGNGGGTTGQDGFQCNSQTTYVGQGGTQAAGGACLGGLGSAGSLGQGGNGYTLYGGGGGGGYYGGGGGSYGGGGGGSSWINTTSVTSPTYTTGINSGNGSLTISWNGTGCASTTVPVTVTVNALTAPTASAVTVACGQTASLTATNNLGGINWYSNAAGTTLLGSGSTYTTPVLSNSTTYYVGAGSGACATAINAVNVTVTPIATPTAANQTINCGGTATLTASNSTGTYVWFSDAACTQQIGTGANYTTPTLFNTTTYYVLAQSGAAGCNLNTLTNILNNLNTNQGAVSAAVPNGYNFTMDGPSGANGNYITDGGNDMYDGGNYISTNLAANIYYSDGVILNSNSFGTGGQYFTKKINNMWVLAANVNAITGFSISGNNGADGSGLADGTTFNVTVACQTYKVMLKRVYNAGDPSINQMVIIPDNPSASHTWNTNTDNTQHDITGLSATTRLYYLLYAAASGGFIDNTAAANIATTFLTQVTAATASVPVCVSSAAAVTVTVNSNIVQPVVSGTTAIGCGNTTTLTSSAGSNTAWYNAATNGTLLGTGSTYTTPSLTSGTTVYAVQATVSSGSQSFSYTGAQQTWTVPAGVTSINVDVRGAQGGTSSYGAGGNGGRVQATLPVTPGQVLYVNVGGQGSTSTAGWNGGGAPYGCACVGGGGGASDIRIGGTALTDRKIVAGGGGGAGYYWNWTNDPGGLGGGLIGGAGYTNGGLNPTYCGQGGTQSAGGAGATSGGPAGTLGVGGANGYYAGSGGGGYYGGGAGYGGGGGGGGSSYTVATASGVTHTQGYTTGNGVITITWTSIGCASTAVAVPITVNALSAPTVNNATIGCGTTATITASNGGGTSYSWFSNANGTGLIGSGATFTTPSITSNTTYYVAASSGLAAGTVYNFSNAGATGRTGPTQAQVTSAYSSSNLAGNVTINTQGIQEWVVPMSGTYRILTNGAQGGGNGGLGARMQGDFNLSQGQKLFIVVGQQGGGVLDGNACGGGGGSFVAMGSATYTTSTPLIVAGGGGGQSPQVGQPGLTTTNGGQGESCQPGGTNGNGGADASACGSGAGGAGGFYTDGASGGSWGSQRGYGFISGAAIGGLSGSGARDGGFGCGAGTHQNNTGGGAGGGYSGGSASYHGSNYEGGGGGSFNSGTNQQNTQGVQSGNGSVTITALTSPCVSTTTPVTITVNPLTAPTATNTTVNCGATSTLTATNNLGGIVWYSNAAGTTQLGTGSTYTTPQLSTTTTYYVGAGTGACATAINPVTVTVNPLASPTVNNATVNCGNTAALTANGGGGQTITWYTNANLTGQVGTGASYTTPALSNTTTYYVASVTGAAAGTTYTFTNCSATGQYGPTQAQVTAAYSSTNLAGTVTSSSGIQLWTVPTSGTYRIEAFGAQGGGANSFGRGAQIRGDFALTAGQQLKILVGQQGGFYQSGSGGGGSFVATSTNTPLLVAGGGGGQYNTTSTLSNGNAVTTNNGQNTTCTTGGAAGAGGNGCASGAAGGGGFNGNGGNGSWGTGGMSFINGGNGGNTASYAQCVGGFGGGGGTHGNTGGGGGGGGYSGGAGETQTSLAGGGGGSYNNGTNQVNSAGVQSGNGLVTITMLTTPCSSSAVPVTVTVNAIAAPTVAGNTSICASNTTVLTASGGSNYTWYANANGTGQLGTGSTYTTPSLNANTTYYVVSNNGTVNVTRTFTNCGVTGNTGPTQVQANTAYAGTPLANLVTINTQGIQEWTVPATGTYTITARGAKGGDANAAIGGSGTSVTISTTLTQGHVIKVLVGQMGGSMAFATGWVAGGGGGTYVYNQTTGQLILVAGGGGGAAQGSASYPYTLNGGNGSAYNVTSGGNGTMSAGSWCSNGTGGVNGAGGTGGGGAGGAGWTSNGTVGSYGGGAGQMFSVGGLGGTNTMWSGASTSSVLGGFGGGAGAGGHTNYEANAGGGGGYSGGGGGGCRVGAGGGGGCYFTGTYVSSGVNNSHGSVDIVSTGVACSSTATAVPVTVNAAPAAPTATNPSICAGQTATIAASANANWYTVPTGGVSIGQAQSYTTPTLNNNVTYYMEGVAGPCVSTSRTAVTVTVNATPASNAGASIVDASTCGKNTVNVGGNALAAGQTGVWSVLSGTNANGIFSLPTAVNTQFTGTYGGSYVLQWAVSNTSTNCTGNDTMVVTFNQPNDAAVAAMIGQGDLLWCGLTGTDWSTSTNWYQKQAAGGVYPNGYYLRMTGAVQPAITNEVFTVSTANGGFCIGNNNPTLSVSSNAEDVYVGPGITWNLTNDSVNIAQNLTNNGAIIAATGVVNFTGSLNSIVSGTGNTQLFNMRVNKSAGATLTLQQPVLVTNNLNMNQGNVFTTSTNLLTLGTSSAAPGSLTYNSGTIVGPIKRYFANATTVGTQGLFPVGTATYNRYADISFTAGPGVDQFLTVEYKTGAPLQGGVPLYNGLPLIASGSLIQNYSADGYWSVIPTNNNYTAPITTASYGVTLFANNLTGMQTPQICRIIKSAGSNNVAQHHVAWQACGTHTPINGAANPQAFLITSTGTQGFSWFNIGTPNSQALPVELLSFSGDCSEGQVALSWQTATEHNSDYFEVEKSRDGMNWQMLTTVDAAGSSTELLNYGTTDANALEGNNYYRLTQVDIDGTTKVYDVINVSCTGSAKGYFSAYPNPSAGAFQVVLNDKTMVGQGVLTLKDTKGAALLNRSIEVKPGINMFSVSELNLAPGVYYIQIVTGDRSTEVLKEIIR